MAGHNHPAILAVIISVLVAQAVAIPSRRLLSASGGASLSREFCSANNDKLSSWLEKEITEKRAIVPSRSTDFESFLDELKDILDTKLLPDRPISYMMMGNSVFQPTCAGDWMEFGVFKGETINMAAVAKQLRCGDNCPPLFGFDTFTGLPEAWKRDDKETAPIGAFSLDGKFPPVESNVQLVKGKFEETLPVFELQHWQHAGNQTISFLHIDCDLYSSTRDVLRILSNRLRPGTVIIFDDLVNYNKYKDGEVKALWEWLKESGAKLAVLGMMGPIPNKDYSMDKDTNEPSGEHPWFHQSVGFVVAESPQPSSYDILQASVGPVDASERDPILKAAAEMDGEDGLGALGHIHHKGAAAQPHRVSRGTRDKHRADAIDVANREAIIPLRDLEVDPEGDVPQDAPIEEIKDIPDELPADSVESLAGAEGESGHEFFSSLDGGELADNL